MVAGYGCVGMGYAGFLGKWEGKEKENSRKKDLKSSSSLPLHTQGRRRMVSFKTTLFGFFLKKIKCNWKEPKNRL